VNSPNRYLRQARFAPLGDAGQRRLQASRVLICGCGALGSVLATLLARAGVGFLRIVDRDFLEWSNLQRQVLFNEADVVSGLPKAILAGAKLRAINSEIEIETLVVDVHAGNIDALANDVQLVLDGTDNFEIRFLLNDFAVRHGIPWVFGGCIGAEGQTMSILPGTTPCLRCLLGDAPPPGTTETCDTAGILAPIIGVIASIQACEAIKILSGNLAAVSRVLQVVDLWHNATRHVRLDSLRPADCPCCSGREFPWLEGRRGAQSVVLCGRNAVQLAFPDSPRISLEQLAAKLSSTFTVTRNPYLLRFSVDKYTLTVFPDGRAIVAGTEDFAEARSVYARYVGA